LALPWSVGNVECRRAGSLSVSGLQIRHSTALLQKLLVVGQRS
jgi:hypothetical protein